MAFSIGQVLKAVALALLGLLLISSAALFWALSSGPIQLSKLTPSIQRAVASLPGDYAVQLKGCELVWDKQVNVLQLRATQVALLDHSRATIVAAPTVNISISIAALMSRVIALSTIELKGVSIHLVRNKNGSLQLGTKTGIATAADTESSVTDFHDLTQVLTHILTALESSPDPQQPLSYLQAINVKGDFTIEDQKLDMNVQ